MSEKEHELQLLEKSGPLQQLQKQNQIEHEALDELQNLYCSIRETLDPEEAKLKILKKEFEEVDAQLQQALDDLYDAESPGVRQTDQYLIEFGYKGKKTEIIDKKKLIDILGLETFIELATISVGDLKKYLTTAQVKLVSEEKHKYKRQIEWAKK